MDCIMTRTKLCIVGACGRLGKSIIQESVDNFDIVEIHNRPESLVYLIKKNLKCKFIFVYHNNPQDLRYSKTVSERLFIVNNCHQIFFVSRWVMRKFFEGLPFDYKNNCYH